MKIQLKIARLIAIFLAAVCICAATDTAIDKFLAQSSRVDPHTAIASIVASVDALADDAIVAIE